MAPALGRGLEQAQRWLAAGCCEAQAEDLRPVLRVRSPPESGARAGYGGAKRKRGPQAALGSRHAPAIRWPCT
jgi:hypothetical protein